MPRLCRLNADIDYSPVRDSLDIIDRYEQQTGSENEMRRRLNFHQTYVPPPLDEEATVTWYEALDNDVRALLCLLNVTLKWHTGINEWKLRFNTHKGFHQVFCWGSMTREEWIYFLGYCLDHGVAPEFPLDIRNEDEEIETINAG
jgi:hypothetical protein